MNRRGVTIMELIVFASIAGVFATMVATWLRNPSAVARSIARSETERELIAGLDIISSDLREASMQSIWPNAYPNNPNMSPTPPTPSVPKCGVASGACNSVTYPNCPGPCTADNITGLAWFVRNRYEGEIIKPAFILYYFRHDAGAPTGTLLRYENDVQPALPGPNYQPIAILSNLLPPDASNPVPFFQLVDTTGNLVTVAKLADQASLDATVIQVNLRALPHTDHADAGTPAIPLTRRIAVRA